MSAYAECVVERENATRGGDKLGMHCASRRWFSTGPQGHDRVEVDEVSDT